MTYKEIIHIIVARMRRTFPRENRFRLQSVYIRLHLKQYMGVDMRKHLDQIHNVRATSCLLRYTTTQLGHRDVV